MENQGIFARLPDALLPWYEENRRDLPWRKDKNPYHIWISEIMLQQTRVEAVKGYYARFLETIPNIATLAGADDDLLHKLWEGLGYYSRVRNLKKAAIQIMECHGGNFPKTHAEVSALAGIGPYTSGAICSIAILIFIDYWNMVEQPLILLADSDMHPLSVFLSKINAGEIALAFAVASIYLIPTLLVYLYGEDYLVEGIAYQGGIKG